MASNTMSRADMMNTIELIRKFWPDLDFTKDDVFSCKPEFIFRFYSTFLAELNDKFSYLLNEEENISDELDEIQDFEKEVIIYCKIARIFKKLKNMPLYLADFYIPNVKKMYPHVKLSIHFVVFINNFLDEVGKIVNENLKKVMDNQHFKELKQQCLQDSAENAENLARLVDVYETFKIKFEEAKKIHEKMLREKHIEDKKTSEKTEEASSLQNEIDNLEYELKLLEDKENDLREYVITESDIETLRNTEKYLEIEQQLWDNNADNNSNEHLENIFERFKKSAKQLSDLSFDNLDVETLLEHKEEVKKCQITHEKTNKHLSELYNNATFQKTDVDVLQKEVEKMRARFSELKNNLMLDQQKDLNLQGEETAKCIAKFEEHQRIQTHFANLEQEIETIKDDRRKLEAAFAKLYQRYLVKDQGVTKEFYRTLESLVKLPDDE